MQSNLLMYEQSSRHALKGKLNGDPHLTEFIEYLYIEKIQEVRRRFLKDLAGLVSKINRSTISPLTTSYSSSLLSGLQTTCARKY
ncbi:hypothetical protein ACS0TY_028454 [Phlomoides rotata]